MSIENSPGTQPQAELAQLRQDIDSLDRELLAQVFPLIPIFLSREALVRKLGAVKIERGLALRDLAREDQKLQSALNQCKDAGRDPVLPVKFMSLLMDHAVVVQGQMMAEQIVDNPETI